MKNFFRHFKGDLFGGVTAGIVALPLALAFGVQSGMGAIAGLYGAIVIGILASIFGGTPAQISGPTGPMTVITAAVVTMAVSEFGGIEAGLGFIILIFLLTGVLQVIMGVLKVGKYVRYIPYPVISGFMTGIGVIIILFQVHPFFGEPAVKDAIGVFLELPETLQVVNWWAVALASGTIAIIYLFPYLYKEIPSPLIALLAITFVSWYFELDVPKIGEIPTGIPELKLWAIMEVDPAYFWTILEFAGTLAALGAIDSLLTSVVADNLTKTRHKSNRELVGQGIGNMGASLIGGIPGAGATMRTVVNVKAGGVTRLSGVIGGSLLLAVLFGLGSLAQHIPMSVLAGILITVGIGIVDKKGFKHLRKVPRTDAVVKVVVLLVTVFGNLLHAVAIGVVLACVLFMKRVSEMSEFRTAVKTIGDTYRDESWLDEKDLQPEFGKEVLIKHLYGPLFFGFSASFKELLDEHKDAKAVIIRMGRVPHMDQSGLYALEEVILELRSKGIAAVVTGLQKQPAQMMRRINIIPDLIPESYIFEDFPTCIQHFQSFLDKGNGGIQDLLKDYEEQQEKEAS